MGPATGPQLRRKENEPRGRNRTGENPDARGNSAGTGAVAPVPASRSPLRKTCLRGLLSGCRGRRAGVCAAAAAGAVAGVAGAGGVAGDRRFALGLVQPGEVLRAGTGGVGIGTDLEAELLGGE